MTIFYALIVLDARTISVTFSFLFPISGYGEEYDDEYDEDASFEDDLKVPEKEEDDNNIYKDMTKHTRYLC